MLATTRKSDQGRQKSLGERIKPTNLGSPPQPYYSSVHGSSEVLLRHQTKRPR